MRIVVKLILLTVAITSMCADELGYIVALYPEKSRPGLGKQFVMKVDDTKVAKLRYPTYYRLAVPPGVYHVTIADKPDIAIVCHLIAGESCYIRTRSEGPEELPKTDLISPEQAFRLLAKLIPLEQEKIYVKAWK